MKIRIIIVLIILIVCAAIVLPLYFFLFKKKDLTQEQASNLVTRIAIDIGTIADYTDSPKQEDLVKGNSEDNIINSNSIIDISDIIQATTSQTYIATEGEFDWAKDIISEA